MEWKPERENLNSHQVLPATWSDMGGMCWYLYQPLITQYQPLITQYQLAYKRLTQGPPTGVQPGPWKEYPRETTRIS